jgi:hypothetical protein
MSNLELKFNIKLKENTIFYDLFIPELIMTIYCTLVAILLLSLTAYHSYLIVNNNTT